jgi:hypothetical protein
VPADFCLRSPASSICTPPSATDDFGPEEVHQAVAGHHGGGQVLSHEEADLHRRAPVDRDPQTEPIRA